MRQRAERNVGRLRDDVRIERLHHSPHHALKARQDLVDGLASRRVADDGRELDRRMTQRKTHELGPGVAGGTYDRYRLGLSVISSFPS